MKQVGFWAEALSQLEPLPRKTAHCDGIGITPAGLKFAVKFGERYPILPATEAVCHELARLCQVSVPDWSPVEWGGQIGFGSHWLQGVVSEGSARWQAYWKSAEAGTAAAFFGRCCALDGFLHNPDRHLKNFLLEQGTAVLVQPHGGDYSCAWWMSHWPPQQQLHGETNTVTIYKHLNKKGFVSLKAAAEALDRLAAIDAAAIGRIIGALPAGWCPNNIRDDLLDWWSGPARQARILTLKGLIEREHLPL